MVKQRKTTNYIKSREDKEGRLLCLVPTCDNLREKYKNGNTKNYCKNHSFSDIRYFTDWGTLRKRVFERDNHTCVKCGIRPTLEFRPKEVDPSQLIGDHIVPIALDGEQWDEDNIQTLCKACDKIKTKKDQKDIARLRRKERLEKLGQKTLNNNL